MNSEQATARVLELLEQEQIEYMIVGAFSCNVHGVPRASNDVDIVAELRGRSLPKLCRQLGEDFRLDPQVMLETLTGSRRSVLHHVPTGFDIELFYLSDDPHHQERFSRRLKLELRGFATPINVQTAEDLIIQKLRWARRKDLDDIVNVLTVSSRRLDWDYIGRWTQEHATTDLLNRLRAEAGA